MTVVGFSDRLMGLLTQLEGAEPEVLLLDWEIAKDWTYNLLLDLQTLPSRPKTIVLSAKKKEKQRLLAGGAVCFISKDSPPDTLLPALNKIRLSLVNKPSSGGV